MVINYFIIQDFMPSVIFHYYFYALIYYEIMNLSLIVMTRMMLSNVSI